MTRGRRWLAAGALLLAAWPAAVAARVGWRTAASLHPSRRPPAALREGDGFEDVAFRARDRTPLAGAYHASANGAVVLFGHGYGGNRDDMRPQAEALIQRGYGVLLFDWRGHGASGGERTTWGAAETSDLQGALDLACPRPGRRCGAVGFSMGGMVLAQVAARDVRLGAIVLEGTPRSLADMLRHDERRHGALGEWAAASTLGVLGVPVASVRPIAETCAISPRPLLLVYGDRDEALAPGTAKDMLAAACAPKRLHFVRGATHLTYATAPHSDLAETLVSFFDAALAEPR